MNIDMILYVLAFATFVLGTFGYLAKINATCLGLALLTLSLLV